MEQYAIAAATLVAAVIAGLTLLSPNRNIGGAVLWILFLCIMAITAHIWLVGMAGLSFRPLWLACLVMAGLVLTLTLMTAAARPTAMPTEEGSAVGRQEDKAIVKATLALVGVSFLWLTVSLLAQR